MNDEMVSVIIPIYNVKPYLKMCIDSVLRQTYSNLEVILVDDGSTDGSRVIAEQYLEIDARVKLVHQINMGLSAARNTGIKSSTGKYIYLLDADDMLHPLAIEKMVYLMHKQQGDIVIGNFEYIDSEENPLQSINPDFFTINDEKKSRMVSGRDFLLEIGNLLNVVAWGKLYKREAFNEIEYPVGRLHEDQYVTYKILYPLSNVVILEDKYYYYRKRTNSITAQNNMERRIRDTLEAYEEEIVFWEKRKEYILWAYSLKNKINCLRQLVSISNNTQEKVKNEKKLKEEYKSIKKDYKKLIKKHIRLSKHKLALSLFFTDFRIHDLLWRLLTKIVGDK